METEGYSVVTYIWGNNFEADVTVEIATEIPDGWVLIIRFDEPVTSLTVRRMPIYYNSIII